MAPASATAKCAAARTRSSQLAVCCFVHPKVATADLPIVERRNCCFRTFVLHLDEAEAARLAGVAVNEYVNGFDIPKLFEEFADLIRCNGRC